MLTELVSNVVCYKNHERDTRMAGKCTENVFFPPNLVYSVAFSELSSDHDSKYATNNLRLTVLRRRVSVNQVCAPATGGETYRTTN